MVKARGPSKGADWLARERGLIRPPYTATSARLFAQKGDPWLTRKEQDKDYPLNRSRPAEPPRTPLQEEAKAIREKLIVDLARLKGEEVQPKDFLPPQPAVVVNPDLDALTKATRAVPKPAYVDPKGTPVTVDQARWRANLLLKLKAGLKAHKPVEIEEVPRRLKVKGGFYRFDDIARFDRVKEKGK